MGILDIFAPSKENGSASQEEPKPPSSEEAVKKEASEISVPPILITAPTFPESDSVPTSPVTSSQSKDTDAKSPKKGAEASASKSSLAIPFRKKKAPKADSPPAHAPVPAPHKGHEHKGTLSSAQQHEKKSKASSSFWSKRFLRSGKVDKQAKKNALVLRTLIIGPSPTNPKITPAYAKPRLDKIKAELSKPQSANKLIAQLRALPIADVKPGDTTTVSDALQYSRPQGPIHAVCLAHSEEEVQRLHFSALIEESDGTSESITVESATFPWFSLPDAPDFDFSLDKLVDVFNEMKIVDLLTAPDLGIGQPGDGPGLLAGAVPTAETVIKGIEQITPQLMALSYATGKSIVPEHTGLHPPTDRCSVLTYWWGLELVLPPPTLKYLSSVHSVSGTVMNFLTALALVNNGVREIMPFIRYISQYVDWEFTQIKAQDKGKGVICAATWIMPAALVPRPWDFPDPPPPSTKATEPVAQQPTTSTEPGETTHPSAGPSSPAPVEPASPATSPLPSPRPSDDSDAPVDEKPVIPSLPPILPPVSLADAVDQADSSEVSITAEASAAPVSTEK